jgi:hypothetical protein
MNNMGWNQSTYEIIGGGLQNVTTHYEDLYSALMAPASNVFQDDYDATREPEHFHTTNKCQTCILDANYKAADLKEIIKCIPKIDDIDQNKLLKLLREYEHLFDGTVGNFETSDVKFNLKEYAPGEPELLSIVDNDVHLIWKGKY